MSWLPAIVLFGSSVFPVGYYLSSSDRDEVGLTGAISVIVPVIGLIFGILLSVMNLGLLIANPVRLGVSLLGVVDVLIVLFFIIPTVIGASIVGFVANSISE